MIPSLSSNYFSNVAFEHVENICDFSVGNISECIHFPDLQNIVIGEFASRIILSLKGLSNIISSLLYFIIGIVLVSSKKEMIRIATRWIVAMMAYKHPFRDWTFMDHPRRNMCASCPSGITIANEYNTISESFSIRRPLPTLLWRSFFDLLPESGCERGRKTLRGQIFSGNLNHSSVIASLGLRVRRGFFHYFTLGEKVNTL